MSEGILPPMTPSGALSLPLISEPSRTPHPFPGWPRLTLVALALNHSPEAKSQAERERRRGDRAGLARWAQAEGALPADVTPGARCRREMPAGRVPEWRRGLLACKGLRNILPSEAFPSCTPALSQLMSGPPTAGRGAQVEPATSRASCGSRLPSAPSGQPEGS